MIWENLPEVLGNCGGCTEGCGVWLSVVALPYPAMVKVAVFSMPLAAAAAKAAAEAAAVMKLFWSVPGLFGFVLAVDQVSHIWFVSYQIYHTLWRKTSAKENMVKMCKLVICYEIKHILI